MATKEELKAEQYKLVKLETYDLSLFIGQSYFNNEGSPNYVIFQPPYCTLKALSNIEKVVSWKSKGLSDEKLTTPTTAGNSLCPSINWYEN